jgi:threonyl-tRNA synthetase
VVAELRVRDLRVSAELDDNRLNAKIRACQNRKIPYMLVVGQREADEGTVSIRRRDGKPFGGEGSPAVKTADFADYVVNKVNTRDLEL